MTWRFWRTRKSNQVRSLEQRLAQLTALWSQQMDTQEAQPLWTPEAQKMLKGYLKCEEGRALRRILLHQCNLQARWSANSEQNSRYRAGYANGFRAMTEFLLITLSETANTAPKDGGHSGASADEERLRDQLSP